MNVINLIIILGAGLMALTEAYPPTRSQSLKTIIQNFVDNDFIIETPRKRHENLPSQQSSDTRLFQVPIQTENMGTADNENIDPRRFQVPIHTEDMGYTNDVNFETPIILNLSQEPLRFRWPGGVVPYEISSEFSVNERNNIFSAMRKFQESTCIRFVPWKFTEHPHYIRFEVTNDERICGSSHFGLITGLQTIQLKKSCVPTIAVIQHELMHALGFLHEQSRSDRDSYMSILWHNIIPDCKSEFMIVDGLKLIGEYDIDSVMHYGPYACSKNRYPTIVSRDESQSYRMGQREGFSTGDIAKINTLYKCHLSKEERDILYTKEMQSIDSYRCAVRQDLCPLYNEK